LGRDLQVFYPERVGRIGRVREDCHTADRGDGLLEQLQPFTESFHTDAEGHPRDVTGRTREVRDEPEPNRIANANHYDGDRLGGVLGGHGSWRRRGYDDVHLEPDQLGREVGQPVKPTLRKSIVDDDVLAFNPPELAQPLPERVVEGKAGRATRENTYPVELQGVHPDDPAAPARPAEA